MLKIILKILLQYFEYKQKRTTGMHKKLGAQLYL